MDKKVRHPIAYVLAPTTEPYATVAQYYEQAGFTVYLFSQLSSLLDTWSVRPTLQSNILIAHVRDGGLMLARLLNESASTEQNYIVLMDHERNVGAAIPRFLADRIRTAGYSRAPVPRPIALAGSGCRIRYHPSRRCHPHRIGCRRIASAAASAWRPPAG